jgi:flagellin-like protein
MKLKNLLNDSNDSRAVSPVIGVILMVAITVILAAVIGSFVLGLGQDVDSAPQASFNFDQEADGSGVDVTVQHRGGDNIEASNLEIRSEGTVKYESGGSGSITSTGSTTLFAAGDSITFDASSGDQIDVVYVSSSGDNVLASYTVQ